MSGSAKHQSTLHPEEAPVAGCTRAHALRAAAAGGAALVGGALVGAWVRPVTSAARPSRAQDFRIIKFLLVLEEAQAAFYDAALRGGALRGHLLEFARTVAPQERQHVQFLRRQLGSEAPTSPRFAFGEATANAARFQDTAIDLEEATAAAYIGQGASLTRDAVLDAARIVAVEARHAAWIRDLARADPAPRAADVARSPDDVLSDLRQKGFLR
jgi:Ferritin-like domain